MMKKGSDEWIAAEMAKIRKFYRDGKISPEEQKKRFCSVIPRYVDNFQAGFENDYLFLAKAYLNILIENELEKENTAETRHWRTEEESAKEAADKIAALMELCREKGISLSLSEEDCQFLAEGKRYRIREDGTIIDLDDYVEIVEEG